MGFPLLFDISGGELIVILLFVLLFFGAKGIPDIARTMGRALRQVRDASNEVQREINKGAHEVRRSMEEQRRAFNVEPPAAPTLPASQPPATEATPEPPTEKVG
jgi:TatA/E family protein of Tat protein translocase